jgi:alkylation response protein AidB-like acyl-CoA dehydrogenase
VYRPRTCSGARTAAGTSPRRPSTSSAQTSRQSAAHDLIGWARESGAWAKATVRHKLADLLTEVEVGRLIAYRTAWLQAKGEVPNYEASIGKVWMALLGIKVGNIGVNLMGPHGALWAGSKWAPLHGRVLESYLLAVSGPIGGGTTEIQRNIIAQRGVGLPRG